MGGGGLMDGMRDVVGYVSSPRGSGQRLCEVMSCLRRACRKHERKRLWSSCCWQRMYRKSVVQEGIVIASDRPG